MSQPTFARLKRRLVLSDLTELHHLLASEHEEVLLLTVDIVFSLYDNRSFDALTLEEHVNIMLPLVAQGHIEQFIGKVLTLVMKHQKFISILFFLVYALNDPVKQKFFARAMKPYSIHKRALFWGMLAFAESVNDFGRFLIEFLLHSGVPMILLLASLRVACELQNSDLYSTRHRLC